jgi:hypothetical protein
MSSPYEQQHQKLQTADDLLASAPTDQLKQQLEGLSTGRIREILGQLAVEFGAVKTAVADVAATAKRTDGEAEKVQATFKRVTEGTDNINALDAQSHLVIGAGWLLSAAQRLAALVNESQAEDPLQGIQFDLTYSLGQCDDFDETVQKAVGQADETTEGIAETRSLINDYRNTIR